MLIDIHSHQPSQHDAQLLRLRSYRPSECALSPPSTYYSLGLHPCYAEDMTDEALHELELRLADEHLLFIGEAGLDKLSPVPMSIQQDFFVRQIELSEGCALPIVVHCVRAWGELLELRRSLRPRMPWFIHGYRRSPELAVQLMDVGCYLSFGYHAHPTSLRLAYERGRLLLETDTDTTHSISEVYTHAAEILGLPPSVLLEGLPRTLYQLAPRLG